MSSCLSLVTVKSVDLFFSRFGFINVSIPGSLKIKEMIFICFYQLIMISKIVSLYLAKLLV